MVSDGSGTPVPNATVSLSSNSIFGGRREHDHRWRRPLFVRRYFRRPIHRHRQLSHKPPGRKCQRIPSRQENGGRYSKYHAGRHSSIAGTVFHFGGTRAAGGVVVTLSDGHSATADVQGRYRIDLVPVGAYTVDATNPATGNRDATASIANQDQVVTTNITLVGVGKVIITVKDGGLNPVSGAQVKLDSQTVFGGRRQEQPRRMGLLLSPMCWPADTAFPQPIH